MPKIRIVAPQYSAEELELHFAKRRVQRAYTKGEGFYQPRRGREIEFRTAGGKFVALQLFNVFNEAEQARRHFHWNQISENPRNRAEIFGRGARAILLRTDGTPTAMVGVNKELVDAIGGKTDMVGAYRYKNRAPGVPHCSLTNTTLNKPELLTASLPDAIRLTELFKRYLPGEYQRQMDYVDRILPDYKIPGTCFTTIYGIKNFPTACHVDKFDIPSGTGVLTTSGDFRGNNFILPEFKLAFDLQPSDALFVDVHRLHGNLPKLSGERVAQVYFVRKGMHECGELGGGFQLTSADLNGGK